MQSGGSVEPFLTRFAVAREAQPSIGGSYCPARHVWVKQTPDGFEPIVSYDSIVSELVTKTATVQEQDDENFIGIPELVTKTDTQQESDDQISCHSLIEMITKTYMELESDDEGLQLL
jgi:hypothetical protein